jgi:hypothetical protein
MISYLLSTEKSYTMCAMILRTRSAIKWQCLKAKESVLTFWSGSFSVFRVVSLLFPNQRCFDILNRSSFRKLSLLVLENFEVFETEWKLHSSQSEYHHWILFLKYFYVSGYPWQEIWIEALTKLFYWTAPLNYAYSYYNRSGITSSLWCDLTSPSVFWALARWLLWLNSQFFQFSCAPRWLTQSVKIYPLK